MTHAFPYLLLIAGILLILPQIIICGNGLDARINQTIEGKGFHRNINYDIKISNLFREKCYIAVYLELPAALYVNVDELADVRRFEATNACSVGETDVEVFMESAKTQNVTICSNLNNLENILKLPLHQRYQLARPHGSYVNITLPKPKLLLGCHERIKEYRVSKLDLCPPCDTLVIKWREIPYKMDQNEYIWSVPIGDLSQQFWISYITLFTTLIAAVGIMGAICKSTRSVHSKTH